VGASSQTWTTIVLIVGYGLPASVCPHIALTRNGHMDTGKP
jgi:hypothetical protein